MLETFSRTRVGMSTYVEVVISPATTTRPVVTSVSQATLLMGSSASAASRMVSEIWSAILSGWPSVTDSEVKRWEDLSFWSSAAFQVVGPAALSTIAISPVPSSPSCSPGWHGRLLLWRPWERNAPSHGRRYRPRYRRRRNLPLLARYRCPPQGPLPCSRASRGHLPRGPRASPRILPQRG